MSDVNIAEIKAQLARGGAQLEPNATVQVYERPAAGTPVSLCAVDAVASIEGNPDYCVHGFASCVNCGQLCYLGSETSEAVSDTENRLYPICLDCANTVIPKTIEPSGRFQDHARPSAFWPPV